MIEEMTEIRDLYNFNNWIENQKCGYSLDLISQATTYSLGKGVRNMAIDQDTYDDWLAESSNYESNVIGIQGASWWLRSPGEDNKHACAIGYNGGAGGQANVNDYNVGVRPCIIVKYIR